MGIRPKNNGLVIVNAQGQEMMKASALDRSLSRARFEDGLGLYDFNFVNSIDNKLIQVSDCIVGLLGKYYTYVNRIDFATAGKMLATITDEQKGALKLFSQIIKKSEDFCKLLLNSIESIEEHDIGAFILTNALFGP